MMNRRKLWRLIWRNTFRNKRRFALSAFGVVVGIAAFVFFLALSVGVRDAVLDIFPLERVEVMPPKATVGSAGRIDDDVVAQIRARPEVEQAVPRMRMNFPAQGRGYIGSSRIPFEAGGFGDGVAASFLADETFAKEFQDWEALEKEAGHEPPSCGPPPTFTCEDSNRYYCNREDMRCHHRVPVIISKQLVEIYNTQFAEAHNLPQVGADVVKAVVEMGGYGRVKIYFYLGDTFVAGSISKTDEPVRKYEAMLVGVSDKAIGLGFTVPIGYIKRWNRMYAGEEAASTYSSVVVTVHDSDQVASLGEFVRTELGLSLEDSAGERYSLMIVIVAALFLAISLIIVTISAINIAHNFFMQVMERRREIGLMRAIGATRGDITAIVLGEAAILGVVSGAIGIAIARLLGLGIDFLSNHYIGDFAFKPHTYFGFRWWILVGGLLFSILFCVLGGYWPARRAARLPPARALVQD